MFISKPINIKFNGVLRTPRILDSCRNQCLHIVYGIEELLLWKDPFFRTDYSKEVEDVTKIIKNCNGFGDYAEFLTSNPKRAKEVMQHIYTINSTLFDKFKKSFHIQNTSPTSHSERNIIYEEYWSEINKEIGKIPTIKPDFGYCVACRNYIDRKQKKKYPDLGKIGDDFWDYTKW